jgi:hypothetical protein
MGFMGIKYAKINVDFKNINLPEWQNAPKKSYSIVFILISKQTWIDLLTSGNTVTSFRLFTNYLHLLNTWKQSFDTPKHSY